MHKSSAVIAEGVFLVIPFHPLLNVKYYMVFIFLSVFYTEINFNILRGELIDAKVSQTFMNNNASTKATRDLNLFALYGTFEFYNHLRERTTSYSLSVTHTHLYRRA